MAPDGVLAPVCDVHEGLAREAVYPRARHDGGYAALSSGYLARRDVGDPDGLLIKEDGARPGAREPVLVDGTLELNASAVFGMAPEDAREKVVVNGGVGKGLA